MSTAAWCPQSTPSAMPLLSLLPLPLLLYPLPLPSLLPTTCCLLPLTPCCPPRSTHFPSYPPAASNCLRPTLLAIPTTCLLVPATHSYPPPAAHCPCYPCYPLPAAHDHRHPCCPPPASHCHCFFCCSLPAAHYPCHPTSKFKSCTVSRGNNHYSPFTVLPGLSTRSYFWPIW